jgi:hypothetical protein
MRKQIGFKPARNMADIYPYLAEELKNDGIHSF